ncbi:hypothetical protein [Aquimarina litoralis]|uniref:hypothetical protein n=1 Tax=Aquimarina litoralis TaxID=584605 RepID=UPI001C57C324|nr:hypothetical protein [Aquimarina litoralis]MBW1294923.1 hypothetical protein [Aquimarina litoralis]
MKREWYFGILTVVFALLIVMRGQTVVPNQEIVLEFKDVAVTSQEVQNAISVVKQKLASIGVKNTRISKELQNGQLRIAYYSDTDVENVQKILVEHHISLNHILYDQNDSNSPELPDERDSLDYQVAVYKIQKSTDSNTDFNGIHVLEIEQKQDRASGVSYSFVKEDSSDAIDRVILLTQKIHSAIAIAIDNTSYKIPEVRAGPIS